jgi:hypothetical protein
VAVAVPVAARRQDDIACLHRDLFAVDDRVRARRVEHHPDRVRRVPVRRGDLARQDHLIGAGEGTGRCEAVARVRVAQHKVAPFGELDIDEIPGRVERGPHLPVVPSRRHERGLRPGPEDRRLALDPSRSDIQFGGTCVEGVEGAR